MRQSLEYGSVRGAAGDRRPYHEPLGPPVSEMSSAYCKSLGSKALHLRAVPGTAAHRRAIGMSSAYRKYLTLRLLRLLAAPPCCAWHRIP